MGGTPLRQVVFLVFFLPSHVYVFISHVPQMSFPLRYIECHRSSDAELWDDLIGGTLFERSGNSYVNN